MDQSIITFTQSYIFWGIFGIILCYPIALYNLIQNGLTFSKSVILITIGIYGGLLGGRILYIVLFFPDLFLDNPVNAIAFWRQTGTWLGAPIGIFILILLTTRIMKKPFWTTIGSFTPGMVLAHGISRMGCLMAGCCYGSKTRVFWAVFSDRAESYVHPTPLYSLLGEVISFIILQTLWRNIKMRQYIFPFYLVLLSTHRFISEFFRGNDFGNSPIPGLRIFHVVCIGLFLFGMVSIIIIKKSDSQNISFG